MKFYLSNTEVNPIYQVPVVKNDNNMFCAFMNKTYAEKPDYYYIDHNIQRTEYGNIHFYNKREDTSLLVFEF